MAMVRVLSRVPIIGTVRIPSQTWMIGMDMVRIASSWRRTTSSEPRSSSSVRSRSRICSRSLVSATARSALVACPAERSFSSRCSIETSVGVTRNSSKSPPTAENAV
jgi:hypothetical protein